ncbi:MAG: RNA-binding protein [Leptolyngbya sp.]|nr:RNA-binding protein [Candidatus Melainabacteria bacterium]
MKTKILVGNISVDANEDKIRQLFWQRSKSVTDVVIPLDPKTGKNRGYAFVEMSSEVDADHAVKELNGTDIEGRSINLSIIEKAKISRKWYQFGSKEA